MLRQGFYLGATALGCMAVLGWSNNHAKRGKSRNVETVGLYLNAAGQKELEAFFKDNFGLDDTEMRLVALKRGPDEDEEFVVSALYGQPCAFRVKGLIQSERGVVATGSVSTMGGKLSMSNYVTGMPVFQNGKGPFSLNEGLDMATRVSRVSKGKAPWQGRVPSVTTLSGETYPAVDASFTVLPLEKQLVVGGTLCSSKYALMDGDEMQCNFTLGKDGVLAADVDLKGPKGASRSTKTSDSAEDIKDEATEAKSAPSEKVAPQGGTEKKSEPGEAEAECPICAYVKNGSCKEPFIILQGYHDTEGTEGFDEDAYKRVAQEMYDCMSRDEYYDAFVLDLKRQTAENDDSKKEQK